MRVENLKDTFPFVDNITVCGRTKEKHDHNVQALYKIIDKYNFTLNNDKTIPCTTSINLLRYTVSNNHIAPDQSRLQPLLEMPLPANFKAQKRIVSMFSYYSKFIEHFSDKINILNKNTVFPIPQDVLSAFQALKAELKNAALKPVDPDGEFTVETDASDFCIAATPNQQGHPVAFFSRIRFIRTKSIIIWSRKKQLQLWSQFENGAIS